MRLGRGTGRKPGEFDAGGGIAMTVSRERTRPPRLPEPRNWVTDTDASVFSPVLRCPTVGHWAVGRNGAYGYKHQYLGDPREDGANEVAG